MAPVNALYLANIQLEIGDIASDFELRSLQEELADCQRYFVKTFEPDVVAADNTGRIGVLRVIARGDGLFNIVWQFPVQMRVAPTVTAFNPSSATANSARNVDNDSNTVVTTTLSGLSGSSSSISTRGGIFEPNSIDAADADDVIEVHATADAEL